MYNCVINSKILRSSLEMVSENDRDTVIELEFKNMCVRFGLRDFEMIKFVKDIDIELLNTHYETIWDGLNYYSMDCINDVKNAYVQYVYVNKLHDTRINNLCDDLQQYIKNNTCVGHHGDDMCNTLEKACNCHHDECVIYLLNNPSQNIDGDREGIVGGCYKWNIIDDLCGYGASLNVIKYLFEVLHKDSTSDAIDNAIKYGHFDIVKYLFEVHHKDCTSDAIDNASKYGYFDIVKYLFEVLHKDCTNDAIDYASYYGYFDIVKYLVEVQHKSCSFRTISWSHNHCEIYDYLCNTVGL